MFMHDQDRVRGHWTCDSDVDGAAGECPGRAQRGRGSQAMKRGVALFVAALLVALVVGHVLRDTPGYMVRNPDGVERGVRSIRLADDPWM